MTVRLPSFLLLLALGLSACGDEGPDLRPTNTEYSRLREPAPPALDDLAITIADTSREMLYTNKVAAFYYGETSGVQRSPWQGFNVRGFEFIDSWRYLVNDTLLLGPNHMIAGQVHPAYATRHYHFEPKASGLIERAMRLFKKPVVEDIAEQVFLPDSLDVLVVTPERTIPEDVPDSVRTRAFRLVPFFTDGRRPDYYDTRVDTASGALLIARRNHMTRKDEMDHPVWLAIWSPTGRGARDATITTVDSSGTAQQLLAPATLYLTEAAPIAFAVADTPEEAVRMARYAVQNRDALLQQKQARMQRLLERSYVATQNGRFNHAFAWARIHMDNLIMNQRGKGIFAGLPWFNNYWGRDTFISLPALWATGEWEEAREILLSFSQRQNRDRRFGVMGRIPNQVTLGNVTYNTVDGTPWYVKSIWDLYRHTGERELIQRRLFADAFWATRGGFETADSLRFLTHGDQETWMDASAGPNREWTPRGNRAAEVQGLWYEQLKTTGNIAAEIVRVPTQARTEYLDPADRLQQNFRRRFVDTQNNVIYDHLNRDNTPDTQLRPNVFFVLRSFDFDPAFTCAMTKKYAADLAYPYGVASLSQADTSFHPYHDVPLLYPKDAAYHNGIVWTWLSGPLVSLIAECGAAEKAYEQIEYLTRLILDRGAVGTIPENLDAIPREGQQEPNLSGTASQAWSLAEYLRNVYEDFAGIRYDRFNRILLEPHLPEEWGTTETRFRVGNGYVTATMTQSAEELSVTLAAQDSLPPNATFVVRAFGLEKAVPLARGEATVVIRDNAVVVNGEETRPDAQYERPDAALWEDFQWQRPHLMEGLPAIRPPEEADVLIPHDVVSREPDGAIPILTATDPPRDDRGASLTYTYPTNAAFKPGILDATLLRMWEDDRFYYFRLGFHDLTQPGWHPEYGFQLTFAALTFKVPGEEGTPLTVGRNAKYEIRDGFDYVLYVGGGFRLESANGRLLAEYRPAPGDVRKPIGNVDNRSVSFALPKSVVTLPSGTRVTLLVGAQDDHGGAGLGDFRDVQRGPASEWIGGGKRNDSQPNIYDVVTGTIRRP